MQLSQGKKFPQVKFLITFRLLLTQSPFARQEEIIENLKIIIDFILSPQLSSENNSLLPFISSSWRLSWLFGYKTFFYSENRVICKNGAVNVEKLNIDNKSRRYIKDLFTTLIDAKWRYTFAFFACNLILSWTLFASFWYLQAHLHGDIDYYERMKASGNEDQFMADNQFTPCVRELYGFMSAFLFSIETQHTIGWWTLSSKFS